VRVRGLVFEDVIPGVMAGTKRAGMSGASIPLLHSFDCFFSETLSWSSISGVVVGSGRESTHS